VLQQHKLHGYGNARCAVREASLAHLKLSDVDIGFVGRQRANARVHQAIADLKVGDGLTLQKSGERWEILRGETCVGRLSLSFAPPKGTVCIDAHLAAVVTWSREDSKPEFAASLKCDRWDVVVPELVFAPVER
jgi:ATP-dependent DNA helicase RecQ